MNPSKKTQNLIEIFAEAAMQHGYQQSEGSYKDDINRVAKRFHYLKTRLENRISRLEKCAVLDPGHVLQWVDAYGSAAERHALAQTSNSHAQLLQCRKDLLSYLGVPNE